MSNFQSEAYLREKDTQGLPLSATIANTPLYSASSGSQSLCCSAAAGLFVASILLRKGCATC
jgi:hypothetical protein